ncbi:MAG: hypothetical protein ISS63_11615 [Desulfobacteraceae bacterium]|nr:hypothetical protein [Desulfobacteraceae bacterium]
MQSYEPKTVLSLSKETETAYKAKSPEESVGQGKVSTLEESNAPIFNR